MDEAHPILAGQSVRKHGRIPSAAHGAGTALRPSADEYGGTIIRAIPFIYAVLRLSVLPYPPRCPPLAWGRWDRVRVPQSPLRRVRVQQQPSRQPMKLLTYRDLVYRLNLSRSTLERMVARAEMPQPVQVSSGAVRFVEDEIEEWIATRPRTNTTTHERKLNDSAAARPNH